MTDKPDFSSNKRAGSGHNRIIALYSAARLAAVQALYQIEFSGSTESGSTESAVIEEFRLHRFGQADEEVSGGQKTNDYLFQELVHGTSNCREEIDRHITSVLDERWPLKRLAIVMRCILRLGTFELISRFEVPAGVVVKEYVDLAHSFFAGKEPGMVNGVLDSLAHQLRPGELEARLERREKSSK